MTTSAVLAEQLPITGLWDDDTRSGPLTISERFAAFHRENPHVYALLLAKALERKAAGQRRIGVKALVEALRWDPRVVTNGEPFKLDNRLTSRYAHRLAQEPDLDGLIETRKLCAD